MAALLQQQQQTTPMPPGGLPAAMLKDTGTVSDKAASIFREMSGGAAPHHHSAARVTAEGFASCTQRLGVELSDATCRDMFEKIQNFGERDPAGLTFTDVQRIVTVYPTLFGVLAYRIADRDMNERQLAVISREEAQLHDVASTAAEQQRALDKAQDSLDQLRSELTSAGAEALQLEQKVGVARDGLQEAHHETIGKKRSTASALTLLQQRREAVAPAKAAAGLDMAEEELQKANLQAELADKETELTALELEQLEKQLEALREMLYNKRKESFRAYDVVSLCKDKVEELSRQVPEVSAVEEAEKQAEACRELLEAAQRREEELASELRTLSSAAAAAKAAHDRLAAAATEQDAALRSQRSTSDSAADREAALHRRLQELREANNGFNTLREQQYAEEQQLVVQEVRLREQRECLEFKEALLRTEASRVVPLPVPSPVPVPVPAPVPATPSSQLPSPATAGPTHTPSYHPMHAPDHSPSKPAPLPPRGAERICTDHSGTPLSHARRLT